MESANSTVPNAKTVAPVRKKTVKIVFKFLIGLALIPVLLTAYFYIGGIEWGDWTIPNEAELRLEKRDVPDEDNAYLALIALTNLYRVAEGDDEGEVKIGGYTWRYTTNGTNATITGVAPATGAIKIPSDIKAGGNTYSVTSIGAGAFCMCGGLTRVTIPGCVTHIGELAFADCNGLRSVTIPDDVAAIERGTFFGCEGLAHVTMGNGVASIGNDTFYGCTNLTDVTIPNGVTNVGANAFNCIRLARVVIGSGVANIGERAFAGCRVLKAFVVDDNNPRYKSVNGLLLSKDGKTLVCGVSGDVVIPDSVTRIGENAFYWNDGLTSVIIPNSVKHIGESAFLGCYRLASVTIPEGVTSISDGAFLNCGTLTNVVLPTSLTSIGRSAFNNCDRLTSVAIPEGVTNIGELAFAYCKRIAKVTIPDSVTSIGRGAFRCSGLKEFEVGAGNLTYKSASEMLLTKDGKVLVAVLWGRESVDIPQGVRHIGNSAFSDCNELVNVMIPEGVTSIGDEAFAGCGKLKSTPIPNSVTNIGASVFSRCRCLKSFDVGAANRSYRATSNLLLTKDGKVLVAALGGVKSVQIPDSVTSIEKGAFASCDMLTSVTIPDGVVTIGNGAFAFCAGLNNVVIGNGVTSIGEEAFRDCWRLAHLTFGDGVTSIGNNAFDACGELTNVEIPNNVTNIGKYAFFQCRGIKRVTIGNGVTGIGEGAFGLCSGLRDVVFEGNSPCVESHAFPDVPNIMPPCTVWVRKGSMGWGVDIPGKWQGMNIRYQQSGVRPEMFRIVRADMCPAKASRLSWKLVPISDGLTISTSQVRDKLTLIREPDGDVSGKIAFVKGLNGGEKGFMVTVDDVSGEGKIGLSYDGMPPVFYDVKIRRRWLVPVAGCRARDLNGRYGSMVYFPGVGKGLAEGAVISPGKGKCGYNILSISDRCVWFEAFYEDEPKEDVLPRIDWPDFSRIETGASIPPPGRLVLDGDRCFYPGDAIKLPNGGFYMYVDDLLDGKGVVFRLLDSTMHPVKDLLCVIVREK